MSVQSSFDAIVLAGYDPDRPDPLVEQSGEPHKVLLRLAGKPMIEYVVKALASSERVGRIVIVGVDPIDGLDCDRELHYLPNLNSLFDNAYSGVTLCASWQDPERQILLTSGDIPLLTGEQTTWFIDACQPYDKDAYIGAVEKSVMERTFPESRRTYVRLVEGRFCNGGLYLARLEAALRRQGMIRDLVDNRKNVFRQIRMLGLPALLKFVFHRLQMDDLVKITQRILQLEVAPIYLPFAESGMDVDKPHQLAQAETYLQHQATSRATPHTGAIPD